MQTRLVHAILSGIIIAIVLGFSLIPTTWQMISQEPTFGPTINGIAIIGIITSVAILAITLLSFKLVRRMEEQMNKYNFQDKDIPVLLVTAQSEDTHSFRL